MADDDKTRQQLLRKQIRQKVRNVCTLCLWRKASTKGENGTPQCSAGPERHGYHVIKDDMVSAWAPAAGHSVGVRWVPRSKEEKKQATQDGAEAREHGGHL